MISYANTIEQLFRRHSSQGPRSLKAAEALNAALDFPTRAYPTIHIAGSNGKGSVATKIAKALEFSGYRVGLYTSPHLYSFRERILINSQPISEEEVVEGMQKVLHVEKDSTFFELCTFLAFDAFRSHAVDVAVIETGLGGRLDATNVITPILSVITSISHEHTAILGVELETIAAEKAGIIKKNVPLILGPKARFQTIYDRAEELSAPTFISRKVSTFFDEENSAIAHTTLTHLAPFFNIPENALEQGLKMRPSCRFERNGEVIFDVAHNPEAVFALLQALHSFFPNSKFRFLVGFSKDKEIDRCLELIASVASHIHLVQAQVPRAATTLELMQAMKTQNDALYTPHSSIEEGVKQAYTEALAHAELLIICGSFYIMADAKRVLCSGQLVYPVQENEMTLSVSS